MTCQWCKKYKWRKGTAVCTRPGGDGKILPSKGRNYECEFFDPRRNCTTCKYRCFPSERNTAKAAGPCEKWALKPVSKWGGDRHGYIRKPQFSLPS